MVEFKDRLKELRNKKDIYQRELAEVIGVSEGAIGMYETGKRTPDKDILVKLAGYFDVSVDYLLGRTEEPFSADKIKKTLSSDPELVDLIKEAAVRKELKQLLKESKNMKDEEIKKVRQIIKILETKSTGA
ncbi:MAG: helix-turn-helix domain-containing protein [Halanaerobiaceae bacterium]